MRARITSGQPVRLGGCFTALAIACLAVVLAGAGSPDEILDLQAKASFLYNLAKFVEWPKQGPHRDGSFSFCVAGDDPLYPVLGQSLRGKMMNERALVVQRVKKPLGARHCNVLFIGREENKRLDALLDGARGGGVLTVGDFDAFADHGGMIQLIKDPNRFHFIMNIEAVNRSGLRISARLLQLAGRAPGAGAAKGKP